MNKKPFLYLLGLYMTYNAVVVLYYNLPKIIELTQSISFNNKSNPKIGSELDSLINVSKTQKFCESVKKLKPILDAYSNVQWPITGAPGLTLGLSSNSSAVEDMCDFLSKTKELELEETVLNSKKWDKEIAMADTSWNLANEIYDFKSGNERKGALNSASVHKAINQYLKASELYLSNTKKTRVENTAKEKI